MQVTRDRTMYRAHKLRHDIVHAFPDRGIPEMTVLRGELALEPGREAKYRFSYPVAERPPPRLSIRFLPVRRFGEVAACGPGAPPVPFGPPDLAELPVETTLSREPVTLVDGDLPGASREAWRRWSGGECGDDGEVEHVELVLRVPDEEGALVFLVDAGRQPDGEYPGAPAIDVVDGVVVYVKHVSAFPAPGVDDLAELVAGAVNLSRKNGWIWFVHPIYFAEQLLNVRLSKDLRTEMATCPDLPPDLPAPDDELVRLQWGRHLAGIGRICLDVDGEVDTCLRTEAAAVQVDNPVDVVRLLERAR
jgi:hypothetical protein